MAKKIVGYVKLQVPAGSANPSPPIGPALGQRGLNIMEFCKAFNAKTQDQEKGMPIPVTITVFSDKSFTFEMKTPPASYFLKKAAKLYIGFEGAGPQFRRLRDQGAGPPDRRSQDEGSQRQRRRNGDAHDRRIGAFDGHRGEGVTSWQDFKAQQERLPKASTHQGLHGRRGGEAGEGARHGQVRRNDRAGDQSRRRSAHADQMVRGVVFAAERHGPHAARRRVRQGRESRGSQEGRCGYRRRGRSRRAGGQGRRSISTAASPRRT